MKIDEVKKIIEPLLPLNDGEKIEAELTYTKTELPKAGLLPSLVGTPAKITKTYMIKCELGVPYGNTEYARVHNANANAAATASGVTKKPRANNNVWDIKNILGTNSNTGNTNLSVYVDRSKNYILKTFYEITYEDGTTEVDWELPQRAKDMLDKKSPSKPERDADSWNNVTNPLLTINIEKIRKLTVHKVEGNYAVGKLSDTELVPRNVTGEGGMIDDVSESFH